MKRSGRWCAVFAGAFSAGVLIAAAESVALEDSPAAFERYRTIIDRMPFGVPPPGFDPALPPGTAARGGAAAGAPEEMTEAERTEEQQRVAASVRVSVLNVTPAGQMMVGFTDMGAQPPEHHYQPVGVLRNGWLVKAVDTAETDNEKITLEKDGIEVTVKLGEGPQGEGKSGRAGAAGSRKMRPVAAPLSQPAPAAASEGESGRSALGRLRARRRQMLQDEAQRKAAADAEERAERERRAAAEQAEQERRALEDAERQKQSEALQQIREELRRQREEKAQREAAAETPAEE